MKLPAFLSAKAEPFHNPFDVDPAQSTIEDRMYAMYAVLRSHESARAKNCKLPLAKDMRRAFNMESWDCGTAACAAGSAGLTPWFQGVAALEGIHVTVLAYENRVAPSSFVNKRAIWGEAYEDMESLFLGRPGIYEGIKKPRYIGASQVRLEDLTPTHVKEALRKIIIRRYGETGEARCQELDRHCVLTTD